MHIVRKYIICTHCKKIYNLFVLALETGRKRKLLQAFLACFAASANKFNFY